MIGDTGESPDIRQSKPYSSYLGEPQLMVFSNPMAIEVSMAESTSVAEHSSPFTGLLGSTLDWGQGLTI